MVTGTDFSRPRTIEGITRPDPRHHYGQIISWVICWPWNLLWTFVVHNPFRYIFQFALHEIQSTFDEISTGEFSEITRDMDERAPGATAPPPAEVESASAGSPAPVQPAPVKTTNWVEPARAVNSPDVESIDETTSTAAAIRTEEPDQPEMEAIADSPSWESLLKADKPEPASAAGSADSLEAYIPPALPPVPEQDPWYAPGSRNQNGGSLTNARPVDPRTPDAN
jgi:hypothetical protein